MNQRPRAVILKFCLGLFGPVYTFFFLHSCVVSVEVSCASGDEVSRTRKRFTARCTTPLWFPSKWHIGHVLKSENISALCLWFICHGGFKLVPRCVSKEESQATNHNCGRVSWPQKSHQQLIDGHPFIYQMFVPRVFLRCTGKWKMHHAVFWLNRFLKV